MINASLGRNPTDVLRRALEKNKGVTGRERADPKTAADTIMPIKKTSDAKT